MNFALLALGSAIVLCPALFAAGDAQAQAPFPSPRRSGAGRIEFASSNVSLLGWKTLFEFAGGSASANDCWGYTSPLGREYAIIGLSNGTGFVDVTDPGDPVIVDFESGVSSLWRCVKVHGSHAYAASEGGDGIQVFDMTNIDNGTPPNRVMLQATVTAGGCTTATHTLALDPVSGFLYRCGGQGCGVGLQGLVCYSLANPALPTFVAHWSDRYVHEAQVVTWDVAGPYFGKQIALCFTEAASNGGDPRLQILDVTNKAAITEIASAFYTGSQFSHQGWTSANKQYLYLNDELDDPFFGGARTRVFNIANLAFPSYVGFFSSGATSIDHNLYVNSNRIYESNYRSGLRVFDNANPTAPTQIGFFDTWPEDDAQAFNSLWSNYPFFASGTIIGSDLEKGLFVWRLGAPRLAFAYPAGVPPLLDPDGDSVLFTVDDYATGDLQAGTVELHYSTGGPFTAVSATALGGGLYEATLPAVPCGTTVEFYCGARTTDGVTYTDPPAGPTQVYLATAAYNESVVHVEDMEPNPDPPPWLVNLLPGDLTGFPIATIGTWTWADPIGTSAQPGDDHTEPGTMCWLTGQGSVGGAAGAADVDGGATSLRSPILDASTAADPYLSYWRWYSNNQGVVDDVMTVDLSNDGGSSWTNIETLGPTGPDSVGGWILHRIRIASVMAPTSTMCVRFRVSDLGNGSIVEAAVDDLRITDVGCTPPLAIESISPDEGPMDGGNTVTITGTSFAPGATVFFGAFQTGQVTFIDSNTLSVVVPPMSTAGPGGRLKWLDLTVSVTVAHPLGFSDTLPNGYTYQVPGVSR